MTQRRYLIAGNWKMNGVLAEAREFVRNLEENPAPERVEVALMPPFTLLHPLAEKLSARGIRLGAQNVYYEPKGAFTGSISPLMLRDAGCHYVILGHSERRDIMGESDEVIHHKLLAAWDAGLEPILCIGEHLEERKGGATNAVLERQLALLEGTDPKKALTIAYEPVWAIGTGVTPTHDEVRDAHAFIHERLHSFGRDCRVLYGGSVNPKNAAGLLSLEGVDGALVGGASLKAESFSRIIAAASGIDR
ncbi:MAG: triose-phosphate isomerase [Zetaproteobacteria bacterium]|nr:MAG: triose-phosphate isomerase [Zetaproteobacteria bacterium]